MEKYVNVHTQEMQQREVHKIPVQPTIDMEIGVIVVTAVYNPHKLSLNLLSI